MTPKEQIMACAYAHEQHAVRLSQEMVRPNTPPWLYVVLEEAQEALVKAARAYALYAESPKIQGGE